MLRVHFVTVDTVVGTADGLVRAGDPGFFLLAAML